jgi:hypothetical protein
VAVAHHQPPATLVDLVGLRGDVGGHLGLQSGGQHPPGAVTHDLIDQRSAHQTGRRSRWCGLLETDYGEHGHTLPTRAANAGLLDSLNWTRREGMPPNTHPQISSIAQSRHPSTFPLDRNANAGLSPYVRKGTSSRENMFAQSRVL